MLKIFICAVLFIQSGLTVDYDGWLNIKLEHSLNCKGEKKCSRGNISLKSIRSGTSAIDQIVFNEKHIEELKALAQDDIFYTVRAIVTSADQQEVEYLSSLKAQALLDSGLTDSVHVWVLPDGGVMSVTFQPMNSTQPMTRKSNGEYQLNTSFYLHYVELAPVPDTASYIQKLEREREARARGDLKDNRSFLVKYWVYIVPIAIFVMISGATNAEPGGGQGSR